MANQRRRSLLFAFLTAGLLVVVAAQTSPPNDQTNWWPAEGTAGDIAGVSVGALQGSVTFPQGVVGRAFGFSSNSYVTVDDHASLDLTAAGSVSLWLFLDVTDGGQSILYKGAVDTNAASYGWSTHEDLLRFDSPRRGSVLKVYKDGQLNTDYFGRTSVSYTHITRLDTPYTLFFGGDQSLRTCTCKLDEIQIYESTDPQHLRSA